MREILFRGRRVNSNEWVQGYLFQQGNGCDALLTYIRRIVDTVAVDPSTVGQYTGLCDKNGNRIFEGDVLRYNDGEILEVEFDSRTAQFTAKTRWLWTMTDYCEVIGNIHDKEDA